MSRRLHVDVRTERGRAIITRYLRAVGSRDARSTPARAAEDGPIPAAIDRRYGAMAWSRIPAAAKQDHVALVLAEIVRRIVAQNYPVAN
jgi:hypothetical protein